jgi:hypothetical protein
VNPGIHSGSCLLPSAKGGLQDGLLKPEGKKVLRKRGREERKGKKKGRRERRNKEGRTERRD